MFLVQAVRKLIMRFIPGESFIRGIWVLDSEIFVCV